jgi:hypothetical protein
VLAPKFQDVGIEKYDGSTNPVEWLEVYQLAIKTTRGGLVRYDKLLDSLLVIIYQYLTSRASGGVDALLESLMWKKKHPTSTCISPMFD